MKKQILLAFLTGSALMAVVVLIPTVFPSTGLSASAASAVPTKVSTQIACARTAIDARENSLIAANTAFEQQVNAAYAAREKALDAAYAVSTWAQVKTKVGAAFTAYSTAMTSATAAHTAAAANAATVYSAAITACGG